MAQWYTCRVNRAGPAADGTDTPTPVIYINLTDQGGAFTGQWFFAEVNSKNEMLAVALAAIGLGKTVNAFVDPPKPGGSPYTQCSRLYVVA
jgi:hypothetical protein